MNFPALEQRYWPFYYAFGAMLLFFSIPFVHACCSKSGPIGWEAFSFKNTLWFLSGQITLIMLMGCKTLLTYALRMVFVGYFMGAVHYFYHAQPLLTQPLPADSVTATIENVEKTGHLCLLTCRVNKYADARLKRLLVLVQGQTDQKRGDSFTLKTALNPLQKPFPQTHKYTMYQLQGVQAQTAVVWPGDMVKGAAEKPFSIIEKSQLFVKNRIQQALGEHAADSVGLVNAFILGDTTGISSGLKKSFAYSGLSHLLAISGLHMTIVIGLVYGLLRFLLGWLGVFWQRYSMRKLLLPVALAAGGGYLLLSGANPPAMRAYGMAFIVLLGVWTDQPVTAQQRLLSTTGILLLLNPFFIVLPGFQLSFMAVWGLVTQEKQTKKTRFLGQFVEGSLKVTARATLATLPLCMYYFDQIPLYSIFANLLAVPWVSFVVIPVIGWALLFPAHGALLDASLQVLRSISSFFGTETGSTFQSPYLSSMQTLCLTVLIGLAFVAPAKQRRFFWAAALVGLLSCLSGYKAAVLKDQQGTLYPAMVDAADRLWVKSTQPPAVVQQLLKCTNCSKAMVNPAIHWKNLEKNCPDGCFVA